MTEGDGVGVSPCEGCPGKTLEALLGRVFHNAAGWTRARRRLAAAVALACLLNAHPLWQSWGVCVFAPALADPPDDAVEDKVEDRLEDKVEDKVEDRLEDKVEDSVEKEVEDRLDDRIDDDVARKVEDTVESEVEDEVESEAEDGLDDRLSERALERARKDLVDGRDLAVQDRITRGDPDHDEAEDKAADNGRDELADDRRDRTREEGEAREERGEASKKGDDRDSRGRQRRRRGGDRDSRSEGGRVDEGQVTALVVTRILDRAGRRSEVVADELVLLAPADVVVAEDRIAAAGYPVVATRPLAGLGGRLIRVGVREGGLEEARSRLQGTLPAAVAVDYNHLYRPAASAPSAPAPFGPEGKADPAQTRRPPVPPRSALALGLVDTAVADRHPCLAHARIQTRHFMGAGAVPAREHGTMTASLMVAEPGCGVAGASPDSPLMLAAVFAKLPQLGVVTTAESIVEGLDWLAGQPAGIIVLALAGPPNALLEAAVNRLAASGRLLVAAAGNDGPHAPPSYPAAYPAVLAVTAVDARHRPYPHAAQGSHIALAAYGVDIAVAVPGGITRASGTSLAAATAGATIARLSGGAVKLVNGDPRRWLSRHLGAFLQDIPPEGVDPVTGYGLIAVGFGDPR